MTYTLSVMIPTYNRADYLQQTVHSVMQQYCDDGWMEVVVVDDASRDELPDGIVAAYPQIRLVKNDRNLGQLANLNQCIRLAQGQWVHILHSDDLVLPGFYQRMRQAITQFPSAGAFFCRHETIYANGAIKGVSEQWRDSAGPVPEWQKKIAVRQCIQTPAIVVNRQVYTHLGGFRTDLLGCEDWEMWHRISQSYSVIFIPEILCQYRENDLSNSGDAFRTGRYIDDLQKVIYLLKSQHGRKDWTQASVRHYEKFIFDTFFSIVQFRNIPISQLCLWWKVWFYSIFFRLNKIPAMIKLSAWVLWPALSGKKENRYL